MEEAELESGSFSFYPRKNNVLKNLEPLSILKGREQKFKKVDLFVKEALSLVEVVRILKSEDLKTGEEDDFYSVANEFVYRRDHLF